jgi:hypothetical protein
MLGIVSIFFSASGIAGEIYSVTGPDAGIIYSVDALNYLAISWTQTSAYTGVDISVTLDGSGSGNAFLMMAIGLGTTTASQIATTAITFPGSPAEVSLFSGLNLLPGTYYLLLSGDVVDQPTGWDFTYSPTIVLDAGITRTVGYYYTDLPPVSYPPDSTYTYYGSDNAGYLFVDVSGTASSAAEPATGPLAGLALSAASMYAARRGVRLSPPAGDADNAL